MSIFCWNCRGLGNPRTICFLKDLIVQKKPLIVFLCKTLCSQICVDYVRRLLGLTTALWLKLRVAVKVWSCFVLVILLSRYYVLALLSSIWRSELQSFEFSVLPGFTVSQVDNIDTALGTIFVFWQVNLSFLGVSLEILITFWIKMTKNVVFFTRCGSFRFL